MPLNIEIITACVAFSCERLGSNKVRLRDHLLLETPGLRRLNSAQIEIHTTAALVKSPHFAISPTHSSMDSRELLLLRVSIFNIHVRSRLASTRRTNTSPNSLHNGDDFILRFLCYPIPPSFWVYRSEMGFQLHCSSSWLVIEKDWCQDFYHLRASRMNGDVWHTYHLPGNGRLAHAIRYHQSI